MKKLSPPAGKGPHRDLDKETFWRKTLREHAAGGQGVRAFCAARGLSEPSFYSWRRAVRERDGQQRPARRKRRDLAPAFVPVVMRPDDASGQVVIGLRGGRTLKLPTTMPVERLVAIVHAIEASGAEA